MDASHHHEHGANHGVPSGLPLNIRGDSDEYAVYNLIRSPTKEIEDGNLTTKMLTKKRPCTVHLNTNNKCLDVLGKAAIIIEKGR